MTQLSSPLHPPTSATSALSLSLSAASYFCSWSHWEQWETKHCTHTFHLLSFLMHNILAPRICLIQSTWTHNVGKKQTEMKLLLGWKSCSLWITTSWQIRTELPQFAEHHLSGSRYYLYNTVFTNLYHTYAISLEIFSPLLFLSILLQFM